MGTFCTNRILSFTDSIKIDSHILAWMYSTSELDELFQILNSINGFKLDNHIGATQHGGPTEMCIHLGSK